jgi:hypothetical protein
MNSDVNLALCHMCFVNEAGRESPFFKKKVRAVKNQLGQQ